MRPLYSLTFTADGDHQNAFEANVLTWLKRKYAGNEAAIELNTSRLLLPPSVSLDVTRGDIEEGRYTLLTLQHPDDQIEVRQWALALSSATDGSTTEVTLTLSSHTTAYGLPEPAVARIHLPRLIREALERPGVKIAQENVARAAFRVEHPEGVPDLVRYLTNPDRALPTVVVSHGRDGQPLVSPDDLQARLLGFARVVEINESSSYQLSDDFGNRKLSCFDGGIRIYWPGFTMEADPYRHPLFLGAHIASRIQQGHSFIEDLFARLIQTSVARGGDAGPLLRSLRTAERKRSLDRRLIRIAEEQDADKVALLGELLKVEAERDALEERTIEMEVEIERLRRELDATQANLRDAYAYEALDTSATEVEHKVYWSTQARETYDSHPARHKRFDTLLRQVSYGIGAMAVHRVHGRCSRRA